MLATLASDDDQVWPADAWPPMRLNMGLTLGSRGGHGDVTYEVVSVNPDHVEFAFVPPFGMEGMHRFELEEAGAGTLVRHIIDAEPRGAMRWGWPLVVEPLHDAVVEDAFDRLERAGRSTPRSAWSPRARRLRGAFRWLGGTRRSVRQRATGYVAAGTVAALSALHVIWATGSPWPLSSQEAFVKTITGDGTKPSAGASLVVAGLLAVTAEATARPSSPARRILALGAAGVIGARGLLGLAAASRLPDVTPEFVEADRRIYSPLCLVLSASMFASLRPKPDLRR